MAQGPERFPIIGQTRIFLDLLDQVSRVAPLDRPVLIIGERGTGKELIAARLHYLSGRWDRRFVELNCAALPETLLESELFGHEAGAFTGAAGRRAGRFEIADGGSLFLDEIANMSLAAQEKLLRIIEYGQFERVGGDTAVEVDVRVIGATNVDLPGEAAAGRFRLDLLDRLAFDVLTVPPLRARREDIPALVDHFARAMARELELPDYAGFTPRIEKRFYDYDWPGNVRELKNIVERAVYRWPDPGAPIDQVILDPFDSPWRPQPAKGPAERASAVAGGPGEAPSPALPADLDLPDGRRPFDFRAAVAGIERHFLAEALAANRYNQKATAAHLSLTYDQLRHAMKKHELLET